jgi:hypothetical protein
MGIVFKNNAKTTLGADLNDSATSATVVDGSVFPSLGSGEFFFCTFDDGTNNEIVKVTGRSSNTLTIVRAQDNTSARSFSTGDDAQLRVTAATLEQFMENWVLEDDDGTEVTVSNAQEVKFIGSGITTNWTDTSNGSDGDPYDLTFSIDAAQTNISSLLNASLVIGRDADNDIDFGTDNNMIFRVNAEDQIVLKDGVLEPVTDDNVDLGSSSKKFKDAFIDGTIDLDNLKISGGQGNDGQVLTSTGSGVAWEDAAGGTPTSIADADGDTKVQCEESADEDIIRFDTGGSERGFIKNDFTHLNRLTINDTGDFDDANTMLHVRGTDRNDGPLAIRNDSGDQSSYRMIHYYRKQNTTPVAVTGVDMTGSQVSHSFISDERLKDELGAADGMNLISELNPIKFKFKDNTGTGSQGFTAQAFKQAFDSVGSYPRGVTIPDDADDYWYLDDTVLIPNLVKAIQEQQEQIEILQNEVEQLKGEK